MQEVSRNAKGQAIVRSATWPYARVATPEEEAAITAAQERGDAAMKPPRMTKEGWEKLVREVKAYERVAAQGNTWGPETSARMFADLVVEGLDPEFDPEAAPETEAEPPDARAELVASIARYVEDSELTDAEIWETQMMDLFDEAVETLS